MPNTKKRDHEELVITNLEFCMLQFYKSQFEAAQTRIEQQQHALKKLKREKDHVTMALRRTQNVLLTTRGDLATEQETNSRLYDNIESMRTENALYRNIIKHNNLQQQIPFFYDSDEETESEPETEQETQ